MRASVLAVAAVTLVTLSGCSAGSPASLPTPSAVAATTPATAGEQPGSCDAEAGLASVPPLHPSVDGYPGVAIALVSPDSGCRIALAVRHADTPATRAHGLMEVPDLPAGTGMLFTYPDVEAERTNGYWMKGTLVPLDIAYLDAGGTIVTVRAMDPCTTETCPSYPPDRPYRAALEVPQGWFAAVGVGVGWRVELPGA